MVPRSSRAQEPHVAPAVEGDAPLPIDDLSRRLVDFDARLSEGLAEGALHDLGADLPSALRAEFEGVADCVRLLKLARDRKSGLVPAGDPVPADDPRDADDDEISELVDGWLMAAPDQPPTFGRFELRRELGRGGFGVVFLVFDPLLGREVALKLPRIDRLTDPDFRARFMREGKAAAGLDHPNIIAVHEAGQVGHVCYLTMHYCGGMSLAQWIGQRPEPLAPRIAARIVADLADGIEHAHHRGILHRDLKPANILLHGIETASPRPMAVDSSIVDRNDLAADFPWIPKICDFGIARLAEGGEELTQSGMMVGTPAYMAPEQVDARFGPIGPPTDVYGLGLILYELLTLCRPFHALSPIEIVQQIVQQEPASPRQLRRGVPVDLSSICQKCLEKKPERRYATAGQLADDLRLFLRGRPVLARPPSRAARLVRWGGRNPSAAALILLSLFSGFGLAGFASWHSLSMREKNAELQQAVRAAREHEALARERARESSLNAYVSHVRLASELLFNGQVRQVSEVLNEVLPRDGDPDSREFTWRYLRRQAENDRSFYGGNHPIRQLALSADGGLLGAVCADKTIRIWDVPAGTLRWSFTGFLYEPQTLAISPDGQHVATGGSHLETGEVNVWNLRTGLLERNLGRVAAISGGLRFLADSAVVVVPQRFGDAPGEDAKPRLPAGGLLLWNHLTDALEAGCKDRRETSAVAVSPDGQMVAAASPGASPGTAELLVESIASGARLLSCPIDLPRVESLEYSPDGAFLAAGCPDRVPLVFSVATGAPVGPLGFHPLVVATIGFARQGQTILGLGTTGNAPLLLQHQDLHRGVAEFQPLPTLFPVRGFAVAHEKDLVALWGPGSAIRLIRTAPVPALERQESRGTPIRCLAYSPDGERLATGAANTGVMIEDLGSGSNGGRSLEGHSSGVTSLAYSANGMRLASGGDDGAVCLWDTSTSAPIARFTEHSAPVCGVAISPDYRLLASAGSDKRIVIHNISRGMSQADLRGHSRAVRAVAFSHDSRLLASVGEDRNLRIWHAQGGHPLLHLLDAEELWCVAFAADDRTVVTAGADGIIRFWDIIVRTKRSTIGGHASGIRSIAISPDGQTLASGGIDKSVRLWHFATGNELLSFRGLPSAVNGVAFSPDGDELTAALEDGSLLTWSARPVD